MNLLVPFLGLLTTRDRQAFEAQVGPSFLREEFGGFPADRHLSEGPLRACGFTLRASPGGKHGRVGPFGYAHLATEGDQGRTVDLVADTPMRAFGAYFRGQQFGEHVRLILTLTDGITTWREPCDLPDTPGFFGVVPKRGRIVAIRFCSRKPDGETYSGAVFSMDDVAIPTLRPP